MKALGIDIGGTGMKGAVVDTEAGVLLTERFRIKTPSPATPASMVKVVGKIIEHFNWEGPIGCAMPGPIKNGIMMTANNLDKSWIGIEAQTLFEKACGRKMSIINDADAAGLAEMRFGAGKLQNGVVLLLTLGTGIGSALFMDGKLIPNTEFGQIEIRGKKGERRASYRVKEEKDLSWTKWSKLVSEYIATVEQIIWPDLIIIGGGVSKESDKFLRRIKTQTTIVPAQLLNEAGIVGAALCAV